MSAVLAITDRRSALFQILFAVFDSLEGFVIVMVHCILRREVPHRTAMTMYLDVPAAQTDFGDPLTFCLVTPSGVFNPEKGHPSVSNG